MHMRIVSEGEIVVDLPHWKEAIPQVGDYIFRPPITPSSPEGTAGRVRSRTFRTHDRVDGKFVQASPPYVELVI